MIIENRTGCRLRLATKRLLRYLQASVEGTALSCLRAWSRRIVSTVCSGCVCACVQNAIKVAAPEEKRTGRYVGCLHILRRLADVKKTLPEITDSVTDRVTKCFYISSVEENR